MTLAIYAPPEVEQAWRRASRMLRVYYFAGLAGFASRKWREELGVRVDGTPSDPMDLVAAVLSADHAMMALRRRHVKAYTLLMHDIERRCDQSRDPKHACDSTCERWYNERGTGVAQLLGLDRETAHGWYEAGKWFVWWLLESDGDEPSAVTEGLDRMKAPEPTS